MHLYSSTLSRVVRRSIRQAIVLISALLSTTAGADNVTVIELFTSQGCNSCPAADKLLAKVAANDATILNLEFHVDYWNQLQYGDAGNWQDPFSAPEFTKRQRKYSAMELLGENGVYTPQAVINGVYGLVGSNRRELKKRLTNDSPKPVSVNIVRGAANVLTINIDRVDELSADVLLVSYLEKTSTTVSSGENHGKIMDNHNVVVDMRIIGKLSGGAAESMQVVHESGENRGCAVLVQTEDQGPILGAARCP